MVDEGTYQQAEVRGREQAPEARAGGFKGTPEERDTILARRAAQLAEPLPDGASTASEREGMNVLVFPLGEESYAFAAEQVREVRRVVEITPLPSTPQFVAGLMNVRGRIVPVLDLRPFFGLSTRMPENGRTSVVILASTRGDIGVLATGHPTIEPMSERLQPLPPSASPGLQAAYVRGVTPTMIVVLDAEALLMDERLVVQVDL